MLDGYYCVGVTLSRFMRRATFVLGIVLAVSFLPVVAEGKGKVRAAGQPNILFVLLDDMRSDGVMNNPAVLPKTKHWLGDTGTNFTQAFTTTPLCCPDRATMWSGRFEHNHGVVDNYAGDNLDRDWISPRYLHDAGYRTALVGKFITDWNWRYEPPHFDDLAAFQGGYTDARFMVKSPGDAKTHAERATGDSTEWIGAKAASLIDGFESRDDQPWFMQVAPHAPHQEQTAPGPDSCNLQKMYTWPPKYDSQPIPPWKPTPAEQIEGGPNGKAEKQDKAPFVRGQNFTHKCGQVTYDGAMRTLMVADDMVDTIMTRLQADGELANTLVLFTTDNGYAWNERGMTSKGAPWTEHVQAPLLVRWDGVFPPGTTDERLVGTEDYLPTFLDAAGYTPPQIKYPFDGRSFLPGRPARNEKYLEFGPVLKPSPKGYKGHRGIPTWASLRTKQWQYIEFYERDDNTKLNWQEYYDLAADPWELNNLLADKDLANDPDVAALSARLHKAAICAGTAGANPCP
ncbi:MAG TPA: sulfatase-like hydrolase/transferase [Acidimicrobiia bacterium]|nr:sulfatase-like hydrolase/transferase [Acidimicrobiia bacterium]